jgi:hypothetical protein
MLTPFTQCVHKLLLQLCDPLIPASFMVFQVAFARRQSNGGVHPNATPGPLRGRKGDTHLISLGGWNDVIYLSIIEVEPFHIGKTGQLLEPASHKTHPHTLASAPMTHSFANYLLEWPARLHSHGGSPSRVYTPTLRWVRRADARATITKVGPSTLAKGVSHGF